jgi:hypothetical protein
MRQRRAGGSLISVLRRLFLGTTVLAVMLAASGADALVGDESLRCGSIYVRSGVTRTQVLAFCGPPQARGPVQHVVVWVQDGIGLVPIVTRIEQWFYDRGPSEFVRVLTFRDAVLDTIELGGYGSR